MIKKILLLIILVIAAVFIAGKIGAIDFGSVPVLNSFFAQPTIKVVVIGMPSPEMALALNSDQYISAGIEYSNTIDPEATPAVVGLGPDEIGLETIKKTKADVFIVITEDNYTDCSFEVRNAIAEKAKSGTKIIIIGNACTSTKEDTTSIGWEGKSNALAQIMPVTLSGSNSLVNLSGRIVFNPNSEIVNNTLGQKNFVVTDVSVTKTTPKQGSIITATIEQENTQTQSSNPLAYAIVESSKQQKEKVIYYAYNPMKLAIEQGNGFQ
ncbi:hypothetical protein HY993_02825, partial [Candidatus Micrarchaeota archaeon]|nr:hypothetical protein [Candidatus Micrarchaeota archaeon]